MRSVYEYMDTRTGAELCQGGWGARLEFKPGGKLFSSNIKNGIRQIWAAVSRGPALGQS